MNSIVTVGTSVNESTQSIHALIEEMTEATGCVSQAMGDITVSMESTVASIQEQASMTGRIQDIIADTVSIADALTNISQSSGKNVETGQALVSNIVSQTEEVESENKLVKKNMTALQAHTQDRLKIISIIQQISGLCDLRCAEEPAQQGLVRGQYGVAHDKDQRGADQNKGQRDHYISQWTAAQKRVLLACLHGDMLSLLIWLIITASYIINYFLYKRKV